jgi:hypothetical protein
MRLPPRRRLLTVVAVLATTIGGVAAAVPSAAVAAAPPTPTGWTQTFLDDFDGSTLSGNWLHSEGTSYPGGPANFGTGEVETNSRNNVSVTGGVMSITARGTGLSGWTSDRIETTRSDFQPPAGGKMRVEARLRLPAAANGQSNGYWPAFWILGAPYRGNWWNWPTVGEVDIMESVSGLNRTWQTMHCGWLDPATGPNVCNEKDGIGNGGSAGACGTGANSCTGAFHTYTMDWSKADQSMTWYVDGRQVWRTQRGVNVPTNAWDLGFEGHGFYLILNLAIGGEMPVNNGVPLNAATTGGGHYDADYVAVYTGGATAPPPPGSTPPTTCNNIALNHPATASSTESAAYPASAAVDGNTTTRWSSSFADNQWWQVDLGSSHPITAVNLNWEAAYDSAYQIQTADSAAGPWTIRANRTGATGGVETVPVTATARYVRLNAQTRATPYGSSLYEIGVCGT